MWIAESDDYADARFLETLVKKAREHLAAGIVYCESWAIDAQGNLLYKVSHYEVAPDRWARDFYNAGRDECARYLVLHNIIPNASAVLFRREVYLKAGPADESMRLAGDWLQWARMLLIADIAYVAQPLNYYRTHTTSVRSKSAVLVTEVVECHQVILAIAEAVPVSGQALLTGSGIILDRWMSRIKADPTRTVKDYYQALAEITARVALPKPSGDRVREWMLKEWVGQITAGKTSFKQLAGTYTMARKSDATILKKLLKRLLKHYYPGIYRAIVPTA